MKLLFGLISLFFLGTHGDAWGQYSKGKAEFRRGDYSRAAASFYNSSQNDLRSQLGLADALSELGFSFSAARNYIEVISSSVRKKNKIYQKALSSLAKLDRQVNLGQVNLLPLTKIQLKTRSIPNDARGFYSYYSGAEAFSQRKFKSALARFRSVPRGNGYYVKSQFYQGVLNTVMGQPKEGLKNFTLVRKLASREANGKWLIEQANLNTARTLYEMKKYEDSISFYAKIPRESDNWLQALFEASWAFFLMEEANNSLGNIHTLHSPFFDYRFFPESYILQGITYLRLCRHKRVESSLTLFKKRYSPVMKDLKKLLEITKDRPDRFFKLILSYHQGNLRRYQHAWAIADALSRTDSFKQARYMLGFADDELTRLTRVHSSWGRSGLRRHITQDLNSSKKRFISDTGKILYQQGVGYYSYLVDLAEQTKLITAELLLGKVDDLRSKLKTNNKKRKKNFIGGMKELEVGEALEYWPFEGEYWEDELGGYVYNIDSKCK